MKANIFACIVVSVFLMGCTPPPPAQDDMDDATQVKLTEAAVSVSQSLQELAEIEKASARAPKLPPPPNARAIGMSKLASVNWSGPIEPLIRKIAAVSSYRVRVVGKAPAIPALVFISAKNIPLADILRDASFQAQKKANIVLYPTSRVIEIRYLP